MSNQEQLEQAKREVDRLELEAKTIPFTTDHDKFLDRVRNGGSIEHQFTNLQFILGIEVDGFDWFSSSPVIDEILDRLDKLETAQSAAQTDPDKMREMVLGGKVTADDAREYLGLPPIAPVADRPDNVQAELARALSDAITDNERLTEELADKQRRIDWLTLALRGAE